MAVEYLLANYPVLLWPEGTPPLPFSTKLPSNGTVINYGREGGWLQNARGGGLQVKFKKKKGGGVSHT